MASVTIVCWRTTRRSHFLDHFQAEIKPPVSEENLPEIGPSFGGMSRFEVTAMIAQKWDMNPRKLIFTGEH